MYLERRKTRPVRKTVNNNYFQMSPPNYPPPSIYPQNFPAAYPLPSNYYPAVPPANFYPGSMGTTGSAGLGALTGLTGGLGLASLASRRHRSSSVYSSDKYHVGPNGERK